MFNLLDLKTYKESESLIWAGGLFRRKWAAYQKALWPASTSQESDLPSEGQIPGGWWKLVIDLVKTGLLKAI